MTNKKNKFIISITLVIFINLLFALLVVFLWNIVESKKSLVFETKNQLALYERRIDHIHQLEQTLKETEESRLKIMPIFINDGSMVNFIEKLESLAGDAGVSLEIKGVSFGRESKKPVFNMLFSGSFEDIYYYLILLENMSYEVEFIKVSIEKKTGVRSWESMLELKLLSFKNE